MHRKRILGIAGQPCISVVHKTKSIENNHRDRIFKGDTLQVEHKYSYGHKVVVLCIAPWLKYGHVVASFILLDVHADTFRG